VVSGKVSGKESQGTKEGRDPVTANLTDALVNEQEKLDEIPN
jgi:hypothetical protein